jgi:small subunit ribosomal protein S17
MTEIVEQAGSRKKTPTRVGVVTSKSADKTIHVAINVLVKNAQYGKYQRRRTRLAVHDPANLAREGDVVEISPCRRVSKSKSWRLVKVVRSSGTDEAQAAAPAGPASATDKG